MAETRTIAPLTTEALDDVERRRLESTPGHPRTTREEDVRYYVTLGIEPTAAEYQVSRERGEIEAGDVAGGYRY